MAVAAYRKVSTVGVGLVIGLVLTALTFGLWAWVMEADPDRPKNIALQFAGSADRARALLDVAGREDAIKALGSSIDRDWWFIPAYVVTLGWWCRYGAQHFRMQYSRRLAGLLAWCAALAGLADVVENIWLLELLDSGGRRDGAARWVTAFAIPKWLLIVSVLPVSVAALLTGLARILRRGLRRHPAFRDEECPHRTFDPRKTWERPKNAFGRQEWNRIPPPPLKKDPRDPRIGVCFSGGGIRSATFNMGALQTLSTTTVPEKLGDGSTGSTVLERTDFLSCVSGGAYIAGALQILGYHHALENPADEDPPTFRPGSPEEHHVRLHGRYIADNLSQWIAAGARVLAGTFMNLLVFALVLFVAARPLGWVQHDLLFPGLQECSSDRDCVEWALRPSAAMWFAVGWPAALGVLVLLVGTVLGAVERDARRRCQGAAFGFLILASGTLLVVWLLPTLARLVPGWVEALSNLLPWGENDKKEAGATVLMVAAGGSLTASAFAIINRPTPASETAKTPRWLTFKAVKKWVGRSLPYVAGLLLGVVALIVFAMFSSQAARAGFNGEGSFFGIGWKLEGRVWAGAAGLLLVLYLTADQTRWSLGPFYKRRLATAFAIRRDGLHAVTELPWNEATTLSRLARPHPKLPEVLVCAAANLSEQSAAPPGRRAVSFVFGAEVVGGPEIGWARTEDFEAVCEGPTKSDATFLSAMAISGAAFASAMGRHSKGAINSLLAASNARLGVWLPSPRYIAELQGQVPEPQYDKVAKRYEGPWVSRRRFSYLFKELFGTYKVQDRFLYLTDGGHYENLGLVELFRRRCQVIVCFDASGDDLITCGTFVEALTLAEEELGVEVDIDLSPLAPRKGPTPTHGVLGALEGRLSERSVVRGTITYWDDTVGHLILAKASLTKSTPGVVLAHAARQKKPTFPNDATGDQFFDQSQFNAYTELGRHVSGEVIEELRTVACLLSVVPGGEGRGGTDTGDSLPQCPPCPPCPPCPTCPPCPHCRPCSHYGPCPHCPHCPHSQFCPPRPPCSGARPCPPGALVPPYPGSPVPSCEKSPPHAPPVERPCRRLHRLLRKLRIR